MGETSRFAREGTGPTGNKIKGFLGWFVVDT